MQRLMMLTPKFFMSLAMKANTKSEMDKEIGHFIRMLLDWTMTRIGNWLRDMGISEREV